jgi:hypothetical protein
MSYVWVLSYIGILNETMREVARLSSEVAYSFLAVLKSLADTYNERDEMHVKGTEMCAGLRRTQLADMGILLT